MVLVLVISKHTNKDDMDMFWLYRLDNLIGMQL